MVLFLHVSYFLLDIARQIHQSHNSCVIFDESGIKLCKTRIKNLLLHLNFVNWLISLVITVKFFVFMLQIMCPENVMCAVPKTKMPKNRQKWIAMLNEYRIQWNAKFLWIKMFVETQNMVSFVDIIFIESNNPICYFPWFIASYIIWHSIINIKIRCYNSLHYTQLKVQRPNFSNSKTILIYFISFLQPLRLLMENATHINKSWVERCNFATILLFCAFATHKIKFHVFVVKVSQLMLWVMD